MEGITTLREALVWVLSSGGAGTLAYFAMKLKRLVDLPPDVKRYVSYLLTAVFAVVAWLASVGLGYMPQPETWQAWLEAAFAIIAPALFVSQGIHGAVDLSHRRKFGMSLDGRADRDRVPK